ncbi:MAG: hypothetical protein LBF38_07950, partial [Deltaproteobacteria bacterium]|nr:hypothetical protein [Deltaproteobacteria bacterium]
MANDKLIEAPRAIMVSASGVNAGKTTLSTNLVGVFSRFYPIIGLKVTTAHQGLGCQRHGEGCGACSFKDPFVLSQELDPNSPKDTSRLLASGAKKVYWLRALKETLAEGFLAFSKLVTRRYMVVIESNSLRQFVKPGLFFFIMNSDEPIKPSAENLEKLADVHIDLGHSVEDQHAYTIVKDTFTDPFYADFFNQFKLSPARQKLRDKLILERDDSLYSWPL